MHFPNHSHRFVTLSCLACSVVGPEPLLGIHLPLTARVVRSMMLFRYGLVRLRFSFHSRTRYRSAARCEDAAGFRSDKPLPSAVSITRRRNAHLVVPARGISARVDRARARRASSTFSRSLPSPAIANQPNDLVRGRQPASLLLGIDFSPVNENVQCAWPAHADTCGNLQLAFDALFQAHGLCLYVMSKETALDFDVHRGLLKILPHIRRESCRLPARIEPLRGGPF